MAFKEWAIVVDALEQGTQSLILRKGGISEGRGGFQPEHSRFLLFPTLFHQQREQVIPAAQQRYDEIASSLPDPQRVRITSWAEIVSWDKLQDLSAVQRLRDQHIWREALIAERFEWGREQAIYALHLRVFRLPQPWEGPLLPAYGGCKSWVEIAEEISTEGSREVNRSTNPGGAMDSPTVLA